MLKRLLNKNNLIIVAVVFLSLMMIPNVVFAESVKISDVLKETISAWYSIILYTCVAVMLVALIVLCIKALITQIASEKATFKKLIVDWLIGMAMLIFLTQFIYALIYLNEAAVNKCKDLGEVLSGIDATTTEDEYDEVTLYDTAVTKAYEIKFSSGTVGMIMYIILVYFTIRFFLVYVKRYLNVVILILIGPIIVTIYAFRKIIIGKGGLLGRWVKELIYNIFIQTIHAAAYATLIGLTVRLSDSSLSFIGAFLTLIVFLFIFEIDKLIRKIFNFVGGSSKVQVRDYAYFMKHPIENSKSQGQYWMSQAQAIPSKIQNTLNPNNLKTKATSAMYDTKDAIQSLDAKNVKVSQEAIEKEKEKLKNPSLPQKIFNTIQGAVLGVVGVGIAGIEKIVGKTKEQFNKIKSTVKKSRENLNQDAMMLKNLGKILKSHKIRKDLLVKSANNEELTEEEVRKVTVIDAGETPEEEVQEIKDEIENSGDDMVAIVHAVEGPQAFLYPEIGSTYMGISVLASSKEEEKVLIGNEEVEEEENQKTKKRTLRIPRIKTKNKSESNQKVGLKTKAKKFKFKRFNKNSVKSIIRSLNRRLILNKKYLSVMYRMQQKVESGEISVRGTAEPVENLQIEQTENVEVRTTSVKYKANLSVDSENVHTTNMQVAREERNKIIRNRRPNIRERKLKASATMVNYHERATDGKWAIYGAAVEDRKHSHETVIKRSMASIAAASSTEIAMQDIIDKGQGMMVSKDVAILFSKQGIKSIVSNLPENQKLQDSVLETVSEGNAQETTSVMDVNESFQESMLEKISNENLQEDVPTKDSNEEFQEDISVKVSNEKLQGIMASIETNEDIQNGEYAELEEIPDSKKSSSQRLEEKRRKRRLENKNQITRQVLETRKSVFNQDEGKISGAEQVSFGASAVKFSKEINSDSSKQSEAKTIVNASLVKLAFKNDVPLNEVNLLDDEAAQDEIIDDLIDKGMFSSEIKSDETKRDEVVQALEERRKTFVTKEKKEYVESVLKRAIAETVVKAADAGETVADKAGNIKDSVVNSAIVDNRFSKLLGEIAKDTVKVQLGVAKEVLVDEMVDHAKNFGKATVQEIKDGVDVYSPTEEEFVAKGKQIKENIEKAGESTKKAVINAVNPFSSGSNKDKRRKSNDDKYDKDQTVSVFVIGCVNNPGLYEMKLGSRVYEAIKKAGDKTPDGDVSQLNLYDYIPNEGATIEVPRKKPEDVDDLYKRCRPVVLKVVNDYISEKEISDPNVLTKLIHMKTLTSKVQKALRNEEIETHQIEELINETIKDINSLKQMGKDVKEDMRIVNIENLELDETEEISNARQRQKNGAKYKEDKELADALSKLKSSSDSSEEQTSVEETTSDMRRLLEELNSEKVYAVSRPKEDARKKYLDMMGY